LSLIGSSNDSIPHALRYPVTSPVSSATSSSWSVPGSGDTGPFCKRHWRAICRRSWAVQLQPVLLNLLLNAAEAVREVPPERRGLVVRATLEQREDGPWAVVAVEDSGVGFREEEVARLFEAFYTTKPGGLGMGLSISRSILDSHGGRLWATSSLPS
jgi:signal transduction histidine kinase